MHESTQRLICRVGFLLLCLVPTTAVLGWSIVRRMPSHVRQQEQQLSDLLGLRATLTGVTHPRPGAMLYEGLRLSDPETGELVVRCRLLEVDSRSDGMTLTASQPEIHASQAECLQRLLSRWLRREFSGESNVQLHAREAIWHVATSQSAEMAITLTGVQGLLQHNTTAAEAQLSFQLAEKKSDEPIELRVTRSRQANPPTTEFSLKTGDVPLPCLLLNAIVDAAGWLGSESQFRGVIRAAETPQGWNGDLQGAFTQVELQTLMNERFPHQLTGTAQIEIERALFHEGRLTEATLALSAGPGVISRSLLVAAVESMHMEASETYPRLCIPLVKYEKLDFQATLGADGLRIIGQADPRSPGAVMYDSQRVLLFQPPIQPQPVTSLLRMLVPSNEVQVPASRETQWLIERLPVPQVMRPKNADGTEPRPTARPRFGGAVGDGNN